MFIQTNTTDYRDTAIKTKTRVFIHPPQKKTNQKTKTNKKLKEMNEKKNTKCV